MRILSIQAAPTAVAVALLASCFSPSASAQVAVTPAPGDLAVSEILFNPATALDDNNAEWFEVTNVSVKVLDLTGVYVQDLETAGSATAPYVQIPGGALPPLFPGKSFVFARKDGSGVNGALPVVDYAYSVDLGVTPPADHSKVSHGSMALANTSIDAVIFSIGAPANLGGVVIDGVTYDPTKAPLTNNNGIAFERANLLQPWTATNVAASSGGYGGSVGVPLQSGTPGATNSNDVTLYPTYYVSTPVSPGASDVTKLLASGPASVNGGVARFLLSNGPPLGLYAIGFSLAASELPLLGGTVLIDWSSAGFWGDSSIGLDAAGKAVVDVPLGPSLLGAQVWIQWYAFDPVASSIVFSNALGVDVCP